MGLESVGLLAGSGASGGTDVLSEALAVVELSGTLSEAADELTALLVLSGTLSEIVNELSSRLVLSGTLSETAVELSSPTELSELAALLTVLELELLTVLELEPLVLPEILDELSTLLVLLVLEESPISVGLSLLSEQAVSEIASEAATKNDKNRFIRHLPFVHIIK